MRDSISAAAAAAMLALLLAAPGARAAGSDVNRTVTAAPQGMVVISNVAGSVRIEAWDRAEVNVTGHLQPGVERLDLTSDRSHERTVVRVVLPAASLRAGSATLLVRVPKASSLEVSTVSADIKVQGVTGAQRLKSVSADIEAPASGADVEIKTVSGDVKLAGSGQPTAVRASTVSGSFDLAHGAGSLEVTTVSGEVTADARPFATLRARSTSGDVKLRGQLGHDARVDVQTVSGDLHVDVTADGGFTTETESFSGDISTCFGARPEKAHSGPGQRLNVTRGGGAAQLRLKSLSGDISICDH